MTIHTAPMTLSEQLEHAHVPHELIPHRRTVTATAEAEALGVEPQDVAKTIVLTTPTGFVLAVLPASKRLDLHKVREYLETDEVYLATEEVLAGAYPQFELGAVPPIGVPGDRVLIDLRVCETEFVLFEAGTHEESVRLKTTDLIGLNGSVLADVCRD